MQKSKNCIVNNKLCNSKDGITLIVLVVTIVILLILASVSIYLGLENNGIIERAKQASEEYVSSAEEEEKQLNDAYGQIDTESGESATLTITMEELNNLIDERSNKNYIDMSNVLSNIGFDVEYEATEDCIITGVISAHSHGIVYIYINDTYMTHLRNNAGWWVESPIYLPLKKGQKIKVTRSSSNTGCTLKAYSILK